MDFGGALKAASLGAKLARGQVKAAVRRAVQNAVFATVLAILGVFAFAFALAAFTVWLARHVGTIDALWLVAGGFAGLALIVYIVWKISMRQTAARPSPRPSPIAAAFEETHADGREPPPGSALGSLAVVALVGYLMARQMFKR